MGNCFGKPQAFKKHSKKTDAKTVELVERTPSPMVERTQPPIITEVEPGMNECHPEPPTMSVERLSTHTDTAALESVCEPPEATARACEVLGTVSDLDEENATEVIVDEKVEEAEERDGGVDPETTSTTDGGAPQLYLGYLAELAEAAFSEGADVTKE